MANICMKYLIIVIIAICGCSSVTKQFLYGNAQEMPNFDWRDRGVIITPVRNQGASGSCWCFATIAVVEAYYAINNEELEHFSEQQLLDCSSSKYSCEVSAVVFEHVKFYGVTAAKNYPYRGQKGNCNTNAMKMTPLATIKGYAQVSPYNETALLEAVTKYPVYVSVNADCHLFQRYTHGILGLGCKNDAKLNHAMALVGYGTDPTKGVKYWICKNSYGVGWGEKGYIRLRREVPDYPGGILGIAKDPYYVV